MDYYQPDFYRFNTDSLFLVDHALKRCNERSFLNVADFGAGCGVIGLELLQRGGHFNRLDLIEYQKEYYPFLKKNIELFGNEKTRTLIEDFYKINNNYDLILSNPPYFSPEASRPSLNLNRKKCRSFVHGSMEDFLELIKDRLSPNGEAFVLVSRSEKFKIPFENYTELFLYKKISLLHFRLDK